MSSVRGVDGEAAAAEVDQGDERVGCVEAEGAVREQPDLAVEAFEAPGGQAEEDRGVVTADRAGELDEWLEFGS